MSEDAFFTTAEAANNWQVDERTVRRYCEDGKIPGAKFVDGSWLIPRSAPAPARANAREETLLEILQREDAARLPGGIYHRVQVDFTYNSNHMEGSTLTHDQTRYIFETNTILPEAQGLLGVKSDDIVETANHFRCIDYIIENAKRRPTANMLKTLHRTLKNGTSDSLQNWFVVGGWKKLPNEVGGRATCAPEDVEQAIQDLFAWYHGLSAPAFDDFLEFHYRFESIHPFQDGNGRVGRLVLFKECLRLGITPFIIDESLRAFYYRGLKEWRAQPGFLRDTCLAAQDKFKKSLDYFGIKYDG